MNPTDLQRAEEFVQSLFSGRTLDWIMKQTSDVHQGHVVAASSSSGLNPTQIIEIAQAFCKVMTADVCPIINSLPTAKPEHE